MSLKIRRYYPLLVLLVLVPALLAVGLGSKRLIAYTVADGSAKIDASAIMAAQAASEGDITNPIYLFDDTVVHTIKILIDEVEYESMITTFQQTGLKEYFHADVIIDGVRVRDVGLRLKGNASLRSAVGGMWGMGGGNRQGGNQGNRPDANAAPEGQAAPNRIRPDAGAAPQGNAVPQDGGAARPDAGFPGGMFNQSSTSKTPLMIKFNEFVSGQTYQGFTRLAIRTYGITYDEAMLAEPVTNTVYELAGMPATQTAFAGVALNGEAERLFTISEVVDDPAYLNRVFTNPNGVLFKAEFGSSLNYDGEDPSAYDENFTQETRLNDADLKSLIDFMRFIEEADDTTFESQLPEHLDVDSFAAYLALNNLLVNLDSLAGMGNNYYMYYDDTTGRFTLLLWDANESLGGLGRFMGGGGGGMTSFDLYYTNSQSFGRQMGGKSKLLTRFLANPTFRALYEQKLMDIYQKAFVKGALASQVETYADLIRSVNPDRGLVDLTRYEAAVDEVVSFINGRGEYLATTELLGSE